MHFVIQAPNLAQIYINILQTFSDIGPLKIVLYKLNGNAIDTWKLYQIIYINTFRRTKYFCNHSEYGRKKNVI